MRDCLNKSKGMIPTYTRKVWSINIIRHIYDILCFTAVPFPCFEASSNDDKQQKVEDAPGSRICIYPPPTTEHEEIPNFFFISEAQCWDVCWFSVQYVWISIRTLLRHFPPNRISYTDHMLMICLFLHCLFIHVVFTGYLRSPCFQFQTLHLRISSPHASEVELFFCCTCWFGFPNLHELPSCIHMKIISFHWQIIGSFESHNNTGCNHRAYRLGTKNIIDMWVRCVPHMRQMDKLQVACFLDESMTFRELILASATLKLTRMNSWLPGHNFLINTGQSQMLEVIVKIEDKIWHENAKHIPIRVHLAVSTYRNALIQPCQGY